MNAFHPLTPRTNLDVLLRHRLRPLGGYFSRLAALLDDPEVFVFLDDHFYAWLNLSSYMTRRNSKAFRSGADLLPFLPRKAHADAAIKAPALASKTRHRKARAKPVVLAPVEVSTKRLVFRDPFLLRHRLLRKAGGFEGFGRLREPLRPTDRPLPEGGDEPILEVDPCAAPLAAQVIFVMDQNFVGPGVSYLGIGHGEPLEEVEGPR
jgi:hypothetical protein